MRVGFDKLFADAFDNFSESESGELDENPSKHNERREEINLCRCHDAISELNDCRIINGETWANKLDGNDQILRGLAKRTDLLLMVHDKKVESTLCVEGKLGVFPDPRDKKVCRPKYEQIVGKFCEMERRMQELLTPPPLLHTVYVIVNNRSREYTRHRFSRKNKEDRHLQLVVMCPSEFLCACGFDADNCEEEEHCPLASHDIVSQDTKRR